jgi:hypothetical protein
MVMRFLDVPLDQLKFGNQCRAVFSFFIWGVGGMSNVGVGFTGHWFSEWVIDQDVSYIILIHMVNLCD